MRFSMKSIIIVCLAIVLISAVLLNGIITGLMQRHDVVLDSYSVSADGTELTMNVSVMSSAGFIRTYKDSGGGIKPHCLTFYSTFGGINSRFGAKNTFVLPLGKDDDAIYFSRPGGGYAQVLQRTKDGVWERI